MLGSSAGQSASVAGELGLRFAANYHVSPATVLEAVDAYRAAFRALGRPRPALCGRLGRRRGGPDDARAPGSWPPAIALWVRSIRRGEGAIPFPTPSEAACHSGPTRIVPWWPTGSTPSSSARLETVAAGLERLQEPTGADELVVTTITHDHADRVRSYELLANAWFS